MRLWSIHPSYLDTQGLNGLWNEAIRAKNALNQGSKHRYFNHSAMYRIKKYDKKYPGGNDTMDIINSYLDIVYRESVRRDFDYNYNSLSNKPIRQINKIPVTTGQVRFETERLLGKLHKRQSLDKKEKLENERVVELHPLFYMVNGEIEDWEKSI